MLFKATLIKFKTNDDGALSERYIKIGPFKYTSVKFEDGSKERDIHFSKYILNICADGIMLFINGRNKLTIDIH